MQAHTGTDDILANAKRERRQDIFLPNTVIRRIGQLVPNAADLETLATLAEELGLMLQKARG